MKSKTFLATWIGLIILCLVLLAPTQGNSETYTSDLLFQTSDQSMWGAGDAIVYDIDEFYGVEWNPDPVSIGGIARDVSIPEFTVIPKICVPWIGCTPAVTTPAVNFGDYGAEASASTNGKIGFDVDLDFDSGSVDVNYPVGITIDHPDSNTVAPGDTFTIFTSFDVDTAASMMTNSPEAALDLDFTFRAIAEASAEVCVVDCTGGELFRIGPDKKWDLIDIDSTTAATTFDILPGGLMQMTAQIPKIDTTGSLSGDSIHSSGEDFLLAVDIDVDAIATTLLGLPPLLEGSDSFAGASVDYTILELLMGIDLNVIQDFWFEPTLMVELALNTGETFDVRVGESIDIVMPESFNSATPLEITPTFRLDNIFTNDTGLRIDPSIYIEIATLALDVDFPDVINDWPINIADPHLDLGPLYEKDWTTEGPAFSVFDKNWELAFPEFTTASFEIVPTPEPGTLLLLGFGLLGMLATKKRLK